MFSPLGQMKKRPRLLVCRFTGISTHLRCQALVATDTGRNLSQTPYNILKNEGGGKEDWKPVEF
jgi:hypothetical protein